MPQVPSSRPRKNLREVLQIIDQHKFYEGEEVILVGVRGYYKNSMGIPGKNDRGIWDDAMFVVSNDCFVAFNANTDPSRVRKGKGTGQGKGMAVLKPGLYRAHKIGRHKAVYPALVQQAGEVTVIRDGIDGDYEEKGWFGINIHPGGVYSTSSLGCQTLPREQWHSFIHLVEDQLKKHDQDVLPYLLVEA